MSSSSQPKSKRKPPHLGLVVQLFFIVLLPLTLLLIAITFGSISIHQKAMRNLVGERDALAVSTAASALSDQIDHRIQELEGVASFISASSVDPISSTLMSLSYLSADFDTGIAIFSAQGELLAWQGDQKIWSAWLTNDSSWQVLFSQLVTSAGKLNVAPSPIDSALLGILSAKVKPNYIILGAFSINTLVEKTLAGIQPTEGQLAIMLVGADHQVLYTAGHLSDQSVSHPGITQALRGESGTVYVKVGSDEHVTAYAPVVAASWALITEESWEAVSTPTLQVTQVAPLVLVPAVVIMLLALWLGARQVVQPLRTLESRAASLAKGDYKTIQEPVGGIAEIQHLQDELVEMAHRVEEAQHSLHGYIGRITEAQEDERRRLARELHDDTLQALIALKQRVQLAQLELQSPAAQSDQGSVKLSEIASLTEQAIGNLRRLTRALRPVYLEDLGLVPSLEMLARETGQGLDISVEFHRQGIERRLDASKELALYRMAQEALSNVVRHSHARQASLSIKYSPDSVILHVEDNGSGFTLPESSAEYASRGHYGLLGMHERAELIGAQLVINTSPGKGTSLIVTLPDQAPSKGV